MKHPTDSDPHETFRIGGIVVDQWAFPEKDLTWIQCRGSTDSIAGRTPLPPERLQPAANHLVDLSLVPGGVHAAAGKVQDFITTLTAVLTAIPQRTTGPRRGRTAIVHDQGRKHLHAALQEWNDARAPGAPCPVSYRVFRQVGTALRWIFSPSDPFPDCCRLP